MSWMNNNLVNKKSSKKVKKFYEKVIDLDNSESSGNEYSQSSDQQINI
jgi:hypothetical protein